MKIARVQNGGGPHTAIVEGDSVRILPGVSVLELLGADPGERERLSGTGREELPLADVRLLSPIVPASVRDFSVFEQHGEGATMYMGGPDAKVNAAWYEMPGVLLLQPARHHRSRRRHRRLPRFTTGSTSSSRWRRSSARRGRNLSVEEAGDHIGGYTIFNDWSERDIAAREARLPFGFHKTKDFANTFGPWIVTPDELEPYRQGDRLEPARDRVRQRRELGGDTLASMAWSFEELVALRGPRSVDRAG